MKLLYYLLAPGLLAACNPASESTKLAAPTGPAAPPTVYSSIVCDGFGYEGSGPDHVFGMAELLGGGRCSWYCERTLVTLPYVGGQPVPQREQDVSPNAQRLFDWETRQPALFSQPLITSLNWTLGLGPDPIVSGINGDNYVRLTAEELSEIGFGGLLLVNGDISSAASYQRYARLKAGRLFMDDTCVAVVHFADTPKVQWLRLNRLHMLDTLSRRQLRLQVTEVYPGQQDERLAIAELQLDGAGGHSTSFRACPGR